MRLAIVFYALAYVAVFVPVSSRFGWDAGVGAAAAVFLLSPFYPRR